MKTNIPFISIVIASYNRNSITQQSIKSALDQDFPSDKYEVIVVDNNSFDGTVEEIEKNFPSEIKSKKLKLLSLKYNSGSSGSYIECLPYMEQGWNYMLKMDEDVILDQSCLSEMIKVAKKDDSISMIGGKVFYKKNPEIIQAIGSKLKPYFAIAKGIGINENNVDRFSEQLDLDGLNGCMVLISRVIYDQIGWFDADYFLYYDDHDLMYKSLRHGFRHVFVPSAVGFHDTSTGSKKKYSQKLWLYYSVRGSLLFLRKNFKIYSLNFWIYFLVHNLKFFLGLSFLLQHSRSFEVLKNLKLYLLGYKHGISNRGGYYDIDSLGLKFTIFSGGRGSTEVSSALRRLSKKLNKQYTITHITNAYDDGKSTGKVREIFQNSILGPSDVRKIQETQYQTLFDNSDIKQFFNFRFDHTRDEAINILQALTSDALKAVENDPTHPYSFFYNLPLELKSYSRLAINRFLRSIPSDLEFRDFSLSNIIYGGLADLYGGLQNAEIIIKKTLLLPDSVLLNSHENKYIFALTEDGSLLHDESSIVDYSESFPIYSVYFLNQPMNLNQIDQFQTLNSFEEKKDFCLSLNSSAPLLSKNSKDAINSSDIIVYGPGTQYSSLYPTYLTQGLGKILNDSKALKIFITNISHDNETPDFSAADQVRQAIYHLNSKGIYSYDAKDFFDVLVVNMPKKDDKNYIKPNLIELESLGVDEIIVSDYETEINNQGQHHGELVAQTILNLYNYRWRNK